MDDLAFALTRFLSGEGTSLATANSLEVLLDAAYPEDETVQDVVVDLASYRPGGGEFLFDTPEMQRRLSRLQTYLKTKS
ncbi:hypothetical protein DPM33_31665 [Mesorhizobium hawassense]|uniref:Uncharacterized protein n=1 Tax=Mesorhizobium hawassense TaxID=1209954 RepID=A0A330H7J0_9HYPH|nr:hypothetical protein [Mesorhizobium hawassense]RAZ84340.1 hypothetical protein DPM33_31665 [Mesorhizobium hawassense]